MLILVLLMLINKSTLHVELLHQRLKNMTEQHKTVLEKTVSMDRDTEQLLQRLKNVTEQHKTVLEKTISMDREMQQLLQRQKNVTERRDSLLCKQDCAGGWYKFGCKCYSFTAWSGSWNKSREFCVVHGADLVVVDSKEEMDYINRWLGGHIWLGATDEASEGMWRWVDGTVLSAASPSWSGGKPDGGKDKNCLKSVWERPNIEWTDESCEDNRYGICEYNLMK
uniref:C-type lectin domain-containing protein n=1 Tax=Gadus morhua TaxID=8049 RepID=A0A8C5A5A1_GADMO